MHAREMSAEGCLSFVSIAGGVMRGMRDRCEVCPVRHQTICSALVDQELIDLEKISRKRHILAHKVIFHEGSVSNQYFNVKGGAIKLIKTLADGQ